MLQLRLSLASPLWIALGRIACLAACVLTLVSAFAPARDAPHLLPWDKAEHFLAFYALAILGAAAFPRWNALWIAAPLLALGGLIEIVQALPIVGRDSDIHDWYADTIGVVFALAPLLLARWREFRRRL